MAEVVLVHGIAQEQKSADGLEADWLPSLAGGVRVAGHPELADRLYRTRDIDVRMAFYGDLFLPRDQQGGAEELDEAEWEFAGQLGREWLRRVAEDASRESERVLAERELAETTGETQGVRAALRPVVNSLTRVKPFARFGVALAERMVVKALRQVTRYLTDEDTRAEIQRRVAVLLDEDTQVVIAHSLGSVVAYEAAHQLGRPLPLLVTCGSPLGLRSVVYDRLRPQPPAVPPQVRRWINVVDQDDLVAARPELTSMFPGAQGVLESVYTVDNGAKPHEATFYLAKRQIGLPVAETLTGHHNQ
ncbi:hypothetical protein [Kibdelosporangium phytohabitans]|uniref:Serine peptidase n=1 Tax=Kibdelosporangium phytohabitans TaxID=860235 RepID=A0A0N7F4U4_9PSEU|nr:hypothetical protein [Kibdelosporangium phytohabitans]ALG12399.1 hypothetical protein AOZ06_41025 [Kibdelosporangium phytohabitans]MBE1463980.1 hypothetical protein [Kibdelosporangium phytohabitans]